METVTLGLMFRVQPEHFKNGTDDMKLKCLATISSVYWKSNEESVEGEKQSRAPPLEINGTNDLNDDRPKSRADRVQGEFSTKIFSFSRKSSPFSFMKNTCRPKSIHFINIDTYLLIFLSNKFYMLQLTTTPANGLAGLYSRICSVYNSLLFL